MAVSIILGAASVAGAQAAPRGRTESSYSRGMSGPPAGPRALLYGFALECNQCRWTREPGNPRPIWEYTDLPFIAAVAVDGIAARAGIQIGDTLIAVDGASILSPQGARRLSLVRLGDRVSLTLRRTGQTIAKVLVLAPPTAPARADQAFQYTARIAGIGVGVFSDSPLALTTDSTGALVIQTPSGIVRIEAQSAADEHRQRGRQP